MNLKKAIGSFLLFLLLGACSYYFLDKEIALFVKKVFMSPVRLSIFSMNISDFLFPLVCIISGIAWAAYFYLVRRGIHNTHTSFFLLIATTVPLVFFLKSIVKFAVGRINTRFWLYHPHVKEFHWFHGQGSYNGFPSGHMAVFTVLVMALWRFYPRYRLAYVGFLLVLASALIMTGSHFLSDVIAGAYLGLIVHCYTLQGLTLFRNLKGDGEILSKE